MSNYSFFWGCTIPARFPFMEKSTRMVLNKLGIEYRDLDGFTCCPEKSLVKNMDSRLWKATAARNLAVSERAECDIMTLCTGCFSVLKSTQRNLATYPHVREDVNDMLESVNLRYDSKIDVKHFIGVLHDDVGLPKLRNLVVKPLKGLKIAVHGGCHLVRPSGGVQFDHPITPRKYDDVIEVLGAESVQHNTKMDCCGGIMDRVDQHKNALKLIRPKLTELRSIEADAITVVCPECFKAFDNNQFFLQRETGEQYNIPVITLPELMGLSMGFDPEEMGMFEHKIDPAPFIKKHDYFSRHYGW